MHSCDTTSCTLTTGCSCTTRRSRRWWSRTGTRAEERRVLPADQARAPLVCGRGQAPASADNFPGQTLDRAALQCQGPSVTSVSTDPRVSPGYQGYNIQSWGFTNTIISRTMSAEVVSNDDFMTSQESITLLPGVANLPMSPKKTKQSWQHILNTPLKLN